VGWPDPHQVGPSGPDPAQDGTGEELDAENLRILLDFVSERAKAEQESARNRISQIWLLLGVLTAITVRPAGRRATAFSFTWVAPGSSAAVRGHTITVDWRRTTATGHATLVKADVAVTYRADSCTAG
jgi:hypothetical protein